MEKLDDLQNCNDNIRENLIHVLVQNVAELKKRVHGKNVPAHERQRWSQVLTNACQVLNTVLRDRQLEDWEKRLRELETSQHVSKPIVKPTNNQVEPSRDSDTLSANTAGSE